MFSFLDRWYEFRLAIGISCTIGLDGNIYRMVLLERESGGITRRDVKEVATLEEVAAYCQSHPKAAIGFQIQGRGVLIRQVPFRDGDDLPTQITKVFPSFTSEGYYYSDIAGTHACWVSLMKREQVEAMLANLATHGIFPAQLFLGPIVLDSILEHLNAYENTYTFAGHHIVRDQEGVWTEYQAGEQHTAKFKTKIGIEKLDQHYVVAYANAFHLLMASYILPRNVEGNLFQENFAEQKAKVAFRTNLTLLLGSSFVLLLLSTLIYSIYFNRNETLRGFSHTAASLEADWQEQKQDVDRKDTLLLQLGWNGGISKSWLLDQLGASLDDYPDITLSEISINPRPEKKVGSATAELVSQPANLLVVKGNCAAIGSLNSWIRSMTHSSWIERVRVTQFMPSEVYGDISQVFQLEIRFRHAD